MKGIDWLTLTFKKKKITYLIGHQNWVKFERKIMKTCKCTEKRNDRP